MSSLAIELAVELLAIATVVAIIARKRRVPYTVFPIVVGLEG